MYRIRQSGPADKGPSPRSLRRVRALALAFAVCLLMATASPVALASEEGEGGGTGAGDTPLYVKVRPDIVVNLKGPVARDFLMVSTTLRAVDYDAVDALRYHMGGIRHQLILLLSEQTRERMLTVEGKIAMREAALERLQGFLESETGSPLIDAVFLSDFVIE